MALSASLGPARFCANCSGKMLNLGSDGGKVRCLCSSCQTGKFSRCGGCHLVPYCSKECQLEHRGQHKKLCKDLARREGPGTEAEVISSLSTGQGFPQTALQNFIQKRERNRNPLHNLDEGGLTLMWVLCSDSDQPVIF